MVNIRGVSGWCTLSVTRSVKGKPRFFYLRTTRRRTNSKRETTSLLLGPRSDCNLERPKSQPVALSAPVSSLALPPLHLAVVEVWRRCSCFLQATPNLWLALPEEPLSTIHKRFETRASDFLQRRERTVARHQRSHILRSIAVDPVTGGLLCPHSWLWSAKFL